MKKIIVVSGPSDVGKTAVIQALYAALCKKFPSHIRLFENFRRGRDFCAVIEIDGVIIGIDSRGDREGILTESLDFLASYRCNIIVCAAHLRGGTVRAVDHFIRKHRYELYAPVAKMREADASLHDGANRTVAKTILASIVALLS